MVFAFVGESSAVKSFAECMNKQSMLSKVEAFIKGIGTGMFQTVSFCSWALIVWVGAFVVTANRATGGEVIAAVMSILKFLRKNIGAVSQEPSLFAGTIKDNLRVGNADADEHQIQTAAELANAHSFISQLPDQYLTEVTSTNQHNIYTN